MYHRTVCTLVHMVHMGSKVLKFTSPANSLLIHQIHSPPPPPSTQSARPTTPTTHTPPTLPFSPPPQTPRQPSKHFSSLLHTLLLFFLLHPSTLSHIQTSLAKSFSFYTKPSQSNTHCSKQKTPHSLKFQIPVASRTQYQQHSLPHAQRKSKFSEQQEARG